MERKLRFFRKIIGFAFLLCLALFVFPWLYFVPGLQSFFSEGFGQAGWVFSLLAMIAGFWIVVGYVVLAVLIKIVSTINEGKRIREESDSSIFS